MRLDLRQNLASIRSSNDIRDALEDFSKLLTSRRDTVYFTEFVYVNKKYKHNHDRIRIFKIWIQRKKYVKYKSVSRNFHTQYKQSMTMIVFFLDHNCSLGIAVVYVRNKRVNRTFWRLYTSYDNNYDVKSLTRYKILIYTRPRQWILQCVNVILLWHHVRRFPQNLLLIFVLWLDYRCCTLYPRDPRRIIILFRARSRYKL